MGILQARKLGIFLVIALASIAYSSSADASQTIKVNDSQNGKTLTISKGTNLTVALHSTFWASSSIKNLTSLSDPVTVAIMPSPNAPSNCQIPGTGCGTVTWKFSASKKGSAIFSATRSSCGEALKCLPSQRNFKVTFLVK